MPIQNEDDPEKACEGGDTLDRNMGGVEFRECLHCGISVRWDMVDHGFFGFKNSCAANEVFTSHDPRR